MRSTLYGNPLRPPSRSASTVLLVEPSQGFSLAQPPTDLSPGGTPYSYNFLMREGALELRPTLTSYISNPQPLNFITGGTTIISSVASHYPLISGTTQFAFYSVGSWSKLSYVSSAGTNSPPSGTTRDYYDFTQSYAPTVDDMVAIAGSESYQTLFAWVPGAGTFSSITSAPRARYVTTFNNFVLALNIRDTGSAESNYVQRVQWSDRGNPLSWNFATNSLAGFEDLLDARGQGTRIMTLDDRVIVFFEDEIWQGVSATGASSFAFSPLDRTVGCPYSWTVCLTPLGICFLGRDFMIYLLPKGGGPATPIGYNVRRFLADRIDSPDRSWSVYDPDTNTFRLYFPIISGTGMPQESVYLNLGENCYAPQSFVHNNGQFNLTRGFLTQNDDTIIGPTWNGMGVETWESVVSTWAELASRGAFASRNIAVGTSNGTMYQESRGTMDGMIPITATWRSQALAADSPGQINTLQQVNIDYQALLDSDLTIRASRDQGETFDPAVLVDLPLATNEKTARSFMYTPSNYPTFEVQTSSLRLRLFRFWAKFQVGGRQV